MTCLSVWRSQSELLFQLFNEFANQNDDFDFDQSRVNRWFKVDDIAISYLYKIAELYGLKVKIKGTVRKDNVPDSVELS